MLVIPAIDIKGGKCVRLLQGDPEKETVYSDDPVAMAKSFEKLGARLIHVVDLDGAFSGFPVHGDIVLGIAGNISIPIEIGGGIRTGESIERYVRGGIKRIILGTAAAGDEFRALFREFGDYIIAGVDARNSRVAIHGWKEITDISAAEYIKELQNLGVKEIIYTDIATDGMMTGPNIAAVEGILSQAGGISLIASGGVSSLADIERLSSFADRGLKGCIVGKAIYDGRINLRDALARFGT